MIQGETSRKSAVKEDFQVWVLAIFAMGLSFTRLGQNGMAAYDDCFYAEEGKEILQSGHWSFLTYNHLPVFHNAPLFMWLVALSDKIFGISVFASKFPSALMGLLTVLLVYRLGREVSGPWCGFFAGMFLETNYLFIKYSRHCMLDVTLAFFTTLSLYAFLKAFKGQRGYYWLWGLGVGLAILTKSAFGLYPALVAGLTVIISKDKKTLLDPRFLGGISLFVLMAGAWVYSQWRVGGQEFVNEHLKFVILGKIGGGQTPWGRVTLLKDMFIYLWPWLPLSLYGFFLLVRGELKDRQTCQLLLAWGLTLPIGVTLMSTQFPFYMMPAFPAWALAGSVGLGKLFQGQLGRARLLNGATGFCLGVVLAVTIFPIQMDANREKDPRVLAPYVKHFAEQGDKVLALRENYWALNNALIFFSDHTAEPIFQNPAELKPFFQGKAPVLCVAHKGDLPELQSQGFPWFPVKYADDLILIANQAVDTRGAEQWGPPWAN